MADIELVIKIPEWVYKRAQEMPSVWSDSVWSGIKNGTPLPKGHGRLIDANKFLKDNEAYTGWVLNSSDWGGENAYKDALEDLVNEAPTIIEADREG
jgi:hypothetical protein